MKEVVAYVYMETKHRQRTVDDIYRWIAARAGKAKTKTKQANKPEQQKSTGSLPTHTNKTYFVKTAETTRDSK